MKFLDVPNEFRLEAIWRYYERVQDSLRLVRERAQNGTLARKQAPVLGQVHGSRARGNIWVAQPWRGATMWFPDAEVS